MTTSDAKDARAPGVVHRCVYRCSLQNGHDGAHVLPATPAAVSPTLREALKRLITTVEMFFEGAASDPAIIQAKAALAAPEQAAGIDVERPTAILTQEAIHRVLHSRKTAGHQGAVEQLGGWDPKCKADAARFVRDLTAYAAAQRGEPQ